MKKSSLFILFLITLNLYMIPVSWSICTKTVLNIEYPTSYQEFPANSEIRLEGRLMGVEEASLDIVVVNLENFDSYNYTTTTGTDGEFNLILFQDLDKPPSLGQWKASVSFMGTMEHCVSTDNVLIVVEEATGAWTSITLETYSQGNEVWVKGDVLAAGAIVYNADLEIVLENPDGEIVNTFTTRTAQMDPNDFSIHGFEFAVLDTSTKPEPGEWKVEVTFEGDHDWPSASNSIIIPIISETPGDDPHEEKTPCTIDVYMKAPSIRDEDYVKGETVSIKISIDPREALGICEITLTDPNGKITASTVEKTRREIETYALFTITDETVSGTYNVQVEYRGNDNYLASSDSTSFIIQPGLGSSRYLPSRCIFNAATIGSKMNKYVKEMRSFRDFKVRSSFTGNNFVNVFLAWYYGWSPPIAKIISTNEGIRSIFRILLRPLIYSMRLSEAMFDLFSFIPELASSISILTASALCGFFYITPLFVFLNRIGLKLALLEINLHIVWLFSLVLTTLGSVFESIIINTIGFGVLAVLVTFSIGLSSSQLSKSLISKS